MATQGSFGPLGGEGLVGLISRGYFSGPHMGQAEKAFRGVEFRIWLVSPCVPNKGHAFYIPWANCGFKRGGGNFWRGHRVGLERQISGEVLLGKEEFLFKGGFKGVGDSHGVEE